ncbi:chaperonin 10-like protein [Apodospora peruviana]|uniref:Chaperonin 10-like protein n=1 Tax=Apodospora peruviana TaxID=516989 RepID=A0AAE0LZ25_9PEZI|nr:chaperonin 10-like protein [Apodospora peruviana]
MEFPLETEALVVMAPGAPFTLTPVVIDELRPDEVLVEMKYSGLCHTDLLVHKGALPILELPAIPGHEGAGIIRAIGSEVRDRSLSVGDYVLLSFTVCGKCAPCSEKRLTKCVAHTRLNFQSTRQSDGSTSARLRDGTPVRSQFFGQSSFARVSAVQEHCVVRCPYPDELALYSPMGCGFQTGAGTVLNILKPKEYHSIVIFGIGSVGCAALMAAAHLQLKQIVAVDIVDRKLNIARQLGATHTLNSSGVESVAEELRRITNGGPNFAVDSTGVPRVIEQMVGGLGFGGTAASIGAPPVGSKIQMDVASFFYANKNFLSIIEGDSYPPTFIPELIDLHRQGRFPIDKICKVYPIKDIDVAVAEMKAGEVIKPVLEWT